MKLFSFALGLAASAFAVSANAQSYPEIDFSARPNYVSNNTLSLTFDDGPDWNNTARVLDVLKAKGVKATFYINSENWSNLWTEGPMRDLVKRMVNEGHVLGNHTQRHDHLIELPSAEVENQIANVENVVKEIFGANAPRLTLLRAPHGEPYQDNQPSAPSADYKRVAPIVAKHAVHAGWALDTLDYNCPAGDTNCVYNSFVNLVRTPGQGAYGTVLMHSVHSQTAGALAAIIDYSRSKGFRFVTDEDMVKAKYGKTSAQLVGGTVTPPVTNEAVYELISRHSGKCLDVSGSSKANLAKIQQWNCNGSSAQRFKMKDVGAGKFLLVNTNSNRCLDIDAWGTSSGTRIIQWDCHGGANQQWTLGNSFNGTKTIRSVHAAGKCLDIDGPSTNNGQKAQIWDCSNGPNQDWTIIRR